MIIDAHAHIFPDRIAQKAVAGLEQQYGVSAFGAATVTGIRSSMDAGNVDASVMLSVATSPNQVETINNWVLEVSRSNPNLIGLGAMHPDHPDIETEIQRMRDMGLRGLKLHSEFQHFLPDEERMFGIYEALGDDMVLVFHAGDEVIPVKEIHTTPIRLSRVLDSFPDLKIVAAHLGGHRCWDDVECHLLGRNIYLDTAYVYPVPGHEHITVERMVEIMEAHGFDRVLFGTDYPFRDQGREVQYMQGLDIGEEHKEMILGANAARLFDIDSDKGK
ncbi:MAG: amidohydrolase family protein [ANME-2 cluster archaeon]|nr:amidohydrolase family protein [ANME-2 cluster archaeon]